MVFNSCSPIETEEIGRNLGLLLNHGSFIALSGKLGGGKTCFVRGLATGLCPESAHLVASPTYAIMNEYPGAIPFYHFDLYRLSGCQEIAELGFDEYFNRDAVCVVEWADRLGDTMPEDRLNICFEYSGDSRRLITLDAVGSDSRLLLQQLKNRLKSA